MQVQSSGDCWHLLHESVKLGQILDSDALVLDSMYSDKLQEPCLAQMEEEWIVVKQAPSDHYIKQLSMLAPKSPQGPLLVFNCKTNGSLKNTNRNQHI